MVLLLSKGARWFQKRGPVRTNMAGCSKVSSGSGLHSEGPIWLQRTAQPGDECSHCGALLGTAHIPDLLLFLASSDFLAFLLFKESLAFFRGAESMVMKFHGNVRGEFRVNFLALFASKPHIFMCGALKLSGIVRTNVRLNIAIPMFFCCPLFF